MIYNFDISCQHKLEYANYWCYEHPHIHPTRRLEVHDFIFMIDGEWEIGLGKKTYTIKSNDVLILPADIQHFGVTPCAPKTHYMYLHIYKNPGDEVYANNEVNSNNILLNNFLSTVENPNIKVLFEKIIKASSSPHIANAYITTLLYELSQLCGPWHKATLAQSIMNYAISLRNAPTNDEIAKHFHISKRTAETVFKKQYHTTIHDYILQYKLTEGKRYLINFPDMKLHTIAEALGFYDEYHFSRMFKRAFGISPREFRKSKI